jgi:hypothetical protein
LNPFLGLLLLPVEYHGIRTPYFTHIVDFNKEVTEKNNDINEYLFSTHSAYPRLIQGTA